MSAVINIAFDLPRADGTVEHVATTLDQLGSPLKRGGVSDIYPYTTADNRRFVVKKFKEPQNAPWDKLEYLQRKYHKAATTLPKDGAVPFVAWPVSLVYEDNSVALNRGMLVNKTPLGFTMLYLDPAEWPSFDNWIEPNLRRELSDNMDSLSYRLWILINCAKALAHRHAEGVAMIDVKPDNIRVNARTLQIALLDVDSYRVTGDDGRIYPGTHWSAGYILPRALDSDDTDSIVASLGEDQDRYCLAVLIFEFLNYGIHPFQGIPLTDSEDNSQDGNARRYRYAYGTEPSLEIKPTPGSVHECWPIELRQMFERAFSPGGSVSPAEWADFFTLFEGKLERCDKEKINTRHIRFEECKCMACTRAEATEVAKRKVVQGKKDAERKSPAETPQNGATAGPHTTTPGGTQTNSGAQTNAPSGQSAPGAFFGWVALWIIYAALSHFYYGTPWNNLWPIKVFAGSPPPRPAFNIPITEPRFSTRNLDAPFSDAHKLFQNPNNPFLNPTKPSYLPPRFGTGN